MAAQGFDSAQPAGNVKARPRLLSRQTVVVGISDGVVLPPADELVPRVQLQASLPAPTQELLACVRWGPRATKGHCRLSSEPFPRPEPSSIAAFIAALIAGKLAGLGCCALSKHMA
jgi:hypothetical protein